LINLFYFHKILKMWLKNEKVKVSKEETT